MNQRILTLSNLHLPSSQSVPGLPPFSDTVSAPLQKRNIVALSETIPSEFQSTSFRLAPSPTTSPSSSSSSATFSEGGTFQNASLIETPPPPILEHREREKTCPYCCLILPTETFSARKKFKKWRHHLVEDLQPYICLHKNCNASDKTYHKFKEWQTHLSQPHDEAWLCPLHDEDMAAGSNQSFFFDTPTRFQNHLDLDHSDLDDTKTQELFYIACRPASLPQRCFVCLEEVAGILPLQRHIASHLQSAFLLALPWRDDIKDVDLVSSSKLLGDDEPSSDVNLVEIASTDFPRFEPESDSLGLSNQKDAITQGEFASRLSQINAKHILDQDRAHILHRWANQQVTSSQMVLDVWARNVFAVVFITKMRSQRVMNSKTIRYALKE